VEAREAAAGKTKRERRVTLKPPAWLGADALAVWKDIKKKLRGIELLDNLDAELLAIYCDAIVHYRESTKLLGGRPVNDKGEPVFDEDLIKATQAWARIITMYADKLGLTPGGRARLAKKKADQQIDEFAEKFGG
jgi:P27 family predicted phage terminase small subunit